MPAPEGRQLISADSFAAVTHVSSRYVMPFKSQAQRRKFAQLLVEGKISHRTFEEWNRETGRKNLPERVGTKKKASGRATSRRPKPLTKKK